MAEIPPRSGVQWIGDPMTDGSFVATFAKTRPRELVREMFLVFARKNGYAITPDLLLTAEKEGVRREEEYFAEIRARGISQGLRDLFGAKRKREVTRIADGLVVHVREFVDLVFNCHRLHLSHHAKHLEFAPEERLLSDTERKTLLDSGADYGLPAERKVAAKVRQLIVEREHRSIHMFANSTDEWHCFFMSFKDLSTEAGNHWREGAHLHFVNHVFDPRMLSKKKVWKALQEPAHRIPTVHVRYQDPREPGRPPSLLYIDEESRRAKLIPHGYGLGDR